MKRGDYPICGRCGGNGALLDQKPCPRCQKSLGQLAYEADVAARSTYHDSKPRKRWSELSLVAQASWEREDYMPKIEMVPR